MRVRVRVRVRVRTCECVPGHKREELLNAIGGVQARRIDGAGQAVFAGALPELVRLHTGATLCRQYVLLFEVAPMTTDPSCGNP